MKPGEDMADKPVAAGKSSLAHIDQDLAFGTIIVPGAAAYLDLGCGAGMYTLALARRLSGTPTIHALDLWGEGVEALAVSAAEQGFPNINPMVADLTAPLPLDDGAVSSAFMATVLHDLPERTWPAILGEIGRVLAPGGRFSLIEFKKLDRGPGPSLAKRIGPEDADRLARPAGFVRKATLDLGEFTYLAEFLKK
ncbi:hypothetical protein AWY79_11365 [Pseudodesulfovibrio indicus]|uniref:Methyltransferase domain-containing protein n=2 Tax=Pseudodesulfovibrio indicus TaxID=1716143 RepID=A0ABM5YVY9_9BACT|nr:hypothetical protein AWY79_11365 [Pseudodesulfovibrio indicus]